MSEFGYETVEAWLESRFMGDATDILLQSGYTDLADVAYCSEADAQSILRLFKKPGHRLKMRLLIDSLRKLAKPSSLGAGVFKRQSVKPGSTAHEELLSVSTSVGATSSASSILNSTLESKQTCDLYRVANESSEEEEESDFAEAVTPKNESEKETIFNSTAPTIPDKDYDLEDAEFALPVGVDSDFDEVVASQLSKKVSSRPSILPQIIPDSDDEVEGLLEDETANPRSDETSSLHSVTVRSLASSEMFMRGMKLSSSDKKSDSAIKTPKDSFASSISSIRSGSDQEELKTSSSTTPPIQVPKEIDTNKDSSGSASVSAMVKKFKHLQLAPKCDHYIPARF